MDYALMIIEHPMPTDVNRWNEWQPILNNLEDANNNNEQIEKFFDNSWLFALQSGLHVLSQTIVSLQEKNISCRVLFFDEKPLFFTSNLV